jgi:hypothetical protein
MIRMAWNVLRIPLLALLTVFAPVARLILGGLSLLSLLMAGFYALELPYRAFPVLGMVGAAVGLAVSLSLYHLLLRALAA